MKVEHCLASEPRRRWRDATPTPEWYITSVDAPKLRRTWIPERVALLKEMYAQHFSCSRIAERLGGGITKSAVIRKIHTLKLEPHNQRWPMQHKKMGTTPKQRAGKANGGVVVTKIKLKLQRRPARSIDEASSLPPDQSTYAVPFLARAPNACAWPLWNDATPATERMVCGAPATISLDQHGKVRLCPYCQRHRAIGYGNKREPFVRRARAA